MKNNVFFILFPPPLGGVAKIVPEFFLEKRRRKSQFCPGLRTIDNLWSQSKNDRIPLPLWLFLFNSSFK